MIQSNTKNILRILVLILSFTPLLAAQQTVYNNFESGHNGWDYNFSTGWTVAGDSVQAQYGVEQAMGFQSTGTGTVSDIWVAFFYVPLDTAPDTVTIRLTPFHPNTPPDPTEVMEEWTITEFGSWSQWNTPQHLVGDGTAQLQQGEWYWLWASGSNTTWCGWALNLDPALTTPHTLRREGENWLPISNETASAFRVDITPTVPVELTSFTANVNKNGCVLLKWTTASETNNRGFEIERKSGDQQFRTIGFQEGFGTSTKTNNYMFNDEDLERGTYTYRLKQIDFNGQYTYSKKIEVSVSDRLSFNLEQNYPNPFNPTTAISYQIAKSGFVSLKVYDILGNEVATLVSEEKPSGHYTVRFDASKLASGIYYYRLHSGKLVKSKKMMLVK